MCHQSYSQKVLQHNGLPSETTQMLLQSEVDKFNQVLTHLTRHQPGLQDSGILDPKVLVHHLCM